jgi:hypothetical protein
MFEEQTKQENNVNQDAILQAEACWFLAWLTLQP